jgi:hypothetical protein
VNNLVPLHVTEDSATSTPQTTPAKIVDYDEPDDEFDHDAFAESFRKDYEKMLEEKGNRK